MKITKRTIDKAIKFLESIPESKFIRHTYTNGQSYCSIGWLSHSDAAPLSTKQTNKINGISTIFFGRSILTINDFSKKGQIKATVINALCLLKEQL